MPEGKRRRDLRGTYQEDVRFNPDHNMLIVHSVRTSIPLTSHCTCKASVQQKQASMVAFTGTSLLKKAIRKGQMTYENNPFFDLNMG
ncbi:hypothetical protein M8C21_000277 [Ambrosia artemisiifolia]|uniref:Uncharacterized protein n=1 Tax=Ambrosia artemisiifolia TaxID=4212 RepID=A0AAD5BNL7_AMBAR|nr:hypothetical protein M8C21_000277 [Ambrosia artemisiifolia]